MCGGSRQWLNGRPLYCWPERLVNMEAMGELGMRGTWGVQSRAWPCPCRERVMERTGQDDTTSTLEVHEISCCLREGEQFDLTTGVKTKII